MGYKSLNWQDTGYVLAYFGKTVRKARNVYSAFVRVGVTEGRKPELVGGGLIRSLGLPFGFCRPRKA